MQRISYRSAAGVLVVDSTSVGCSAGVETVLHTYDLPLRPGSYFWKGSVGQFVRVTSYGTFAGNANNKFLQLYCGTSLYSFNQPANGGDYKLVSEIYKEDISTFRVLTTFITDNVTYPVNISRIGYAAAGTRLGEGAIIKTTANCVGASDITEHYFRVELFLSPDGY